MTDPEPCSTRTVLAAWRLDPVLCPGHQPMPLDQALGKMLEASLHMTAGGHRLLGKPRLRVCTVAQAFELDGPATLQVVMGMPATHTLLALSLDVTCAPVEQPC